MPMEMYVTFVDWRNKFCRGNMAWVALFSVTMLGRAGFYCLPSLITAIAITCDCLSIYVVPYLRTFSFIRTPILIKPELKNCARKPDG